MRVAERLFVGVIVAVVVYAVANGLWLVTQLALGVKP